MSDRPSELSELLGDVEKVLRRFIVLGDSEITAIALWIVHTHVFSCFDVTPYLFISSPEKQCGKTTLLRIIERLSARGIRADNITPAALFRYVDGRKPSLLVDEIETIFDREGNEQMRGVLNAGFERGGRVIRCVGEGTSQEVIAFEVFCPKAFAGIGKRNLPDTVVDRSIEIRVKKKKRDEKTERARHKVLLEQLEPLRLRLEGWAGGEPDFGTPELPDVLDDRAQDCWEPLLAIADAAGGDWPERAIKAAEALSANGDRENVSHRVELLGAVRAVFESRGVDRISSRDLIEALCRDPEAFWHGWWDGELSKPMPGAERKLSGILHEFGIPRPKKLRIGSLAVRGYERGAEMEDAFARYLPPASYPEQAEHVELAPEPGTEKPPQQANVPDVPNVPPGGQGNGSVPDNGHLEPDPGPSPCVVCGNGYQTYDGRCLDCLE
jgi:Protein of unknown function (DUF3631)